MVRHRTPTYSRRTTYGLYCSVTILTAVILYSRYRISTSPTFTSPFDINANAVAFRPPVVSSTVKPSRPSSLNTGLDAEDGKSIFSLPPGTADGGFWSTSNRDENYNPMIPNSIPISEITVITCILPPSLAHICSPKTSLKETTLRGEWIRVERDLNRRVGVYYLYFFYRRLLPNSRLGVVTAATLLTQSPTSDDLPTSGSSIWVEVSQSLRAGVWPKAPPMFFHYRLTPQHEVSDARDKNDGDAGDLEPFTEIDVIYGQSNPAWGFEKMPKQITGGEDDENRERQRGGKGIRAGVSLAIRRKNLPLPIVPTLTFSQKGKFRILQIADLHLSTGSGQCRDVAEEKKADCEKDGADAYSLEWFRRSISESQPDLVVLTGDQLNGQDTSFSPFSTIMKFAPYLWEKKIPWTAIFGNHDGEVGEGKSEQMALMKSLPYFLGSAGPSTVDGIGNYQLSVHSPSKANETLFSLYFLDSHANEPKSTFSFFKTAGYDFLKPSQINWFRTQSSAVQPIMRPYQFSTPSAVYSNSKSKPNKLPLDSNSKSKPNELPLDNVFDDKKKRQDMNIDSSLDGDVGTGSTVLPDDGDKITAGEMMDLDSYEAELEGARIVPFVPEVGPTKSKPLLAKPNAIAFFHIPLRESYDSPIDYSSARKQIVTGRRYEGEGASKTNSNFFEQAILAQKEIIVENSEAGKKQDDFWEGEFNSITKGRPEVKVVANGHCHLSQDCRQVSGVSLCFAGGASYSGYGKDSVRREMRVYDLEDFGETIKSARLVDLGQGDQVGNLVEMITLSGEGAVV